MVDEPRDRAGYQKDSYAKNKDAIAERKRLKRLAEKDEANVIKTIQS